MTLITGRTFRLVLFGLSASLLSACDEVFDCVVDRKPVLISSDLTEPVLNQEFKSKITVEIQNKIWYDQFDYEWTFTGDLPPGIDYRVDDNTMNFEGTATSLGEYFYRVKVVANPAPTSTRDTSLCYDHDSDDFRMKVEEET